MCLLSIAWIGCIDVSLCLGAERAEIGGKVGMRKMIRSLIMGTSCTVPGTLRCEKAQ
jgi:hypothetical protein